MKLTVEWRPSLSAEALATPPARLRQILQELANFRKFDLRRPPPGRPGPPLDARRSFLAMQPSASDRPCPRERPSRSVCGKLRPPRLHPPRRAETRAALQRRRPVCALANSRCRLHGGIGLLLDAFAETLCPGGNFRILVPIGCFQINHRAVPELEQFLVGLLCACTRGSPSCLMSCSSRFGSGSG